MEIIPIIENKDGINVVSSRTVAEQLGKLHKDVLKQLDKLLESENVRSLIITSTYEVEGQTRKYKEYLLTKDGFTLYMFNIQGYNDFKMAYINQFNKMEQALKTQKALPSNYVEALKELVKSEEEKQKLIGEIEIKQQQIEEFKPIKEYVDIILSSKKTVTTTQIAADYGLSAKALNKILETERVQRKVNGQWILYINHMNKGYTKSETFEINGEPRINTQWTQKGRLKIHEILTNLGYKANLDNEKREKNER